MGPNEPHVTTNAYFGPNLTFLGPMFLILTEGRKSFGTHLTEKPPGKLVRIVFWPGIGSNGPEMPRFGPKCHFFGGGGWSKTFGSLISGNQ